jgi:hypothetical protein
MISFKLLETYKQLIQFPSQIFQTSLTILLTVRLRLKKERIRNLILEEENGLLEKDFFFTNKNPFFSSYQVMQFYHFNYLKCQNNYQQMNK